MKYCPKCNATYVTVTALDDERRIWRQVENGEWIETTLHLQSIARQNFNIEFTCRVCNNIWYGVETLDNLLEVK
jgi:hypothetical protein